MTLDFQEQLQRSLGEVYRIERELGGGGMSRVFVALETSLQRKVVVKVLLPDLAAGVSVDRFRREIYLAAQLQHPHIVPLLSAGESAGLPYFTMPYVDGESLRARLLRERELPVPQAVRILRDVASALAYAHAQGVVHRDIKPDNVLLSHGVAVVTDFGVAKALTVSSGPEGQLAGPGLTSLGITLGTPAYMAPEQGAADPGMDHRVDIYAFGATAYEILTGDPPFTGRSPHAILGAHLAELPGPISSRRPGIPPLLAHLIMKCLEKRPSDRPQSAEEIISTLDTLTTPSGVTVPIATMKLHRQGKRRDAIYARARRLAIPTALIMLAGVAAVLFWPRRTRAPAVGVQTDTLAHQPVSPPPPATPAPQPEPVAAETVSSTAPVPATARTPPVRPATPRSQPKATRPSAEDSALLARLHSDAAAARARATNAGADDSIIAQGDAIVARAESLAASRHNAEAAAQLSTAVALWSSAPAPNRPRDSAETRRPPPPPPLPPPVPADPAPQIRALFSQYAAAIESRSVEAIRMTYPGLQPSQAQEWEEFFRGVTDVDVDLKVTDLKVAGNAAEARLAGVYVFRNPSTGKTQRENVSFQASLRREGDRWRIGSLR